MPLLLLFAILQCYSCAMHAIDGNWTIAMMYLAHLAEVYIRGELGLALLNYSGASYSGGFREEDSL